MADGERASKKAKKTSSKAKIGKKSSKTKKSGSDDLPSDNDPGAVTRSGNVGKL